MVQPSVMEIIIAAKDAFSKTFDKIDADLKELARTGNSVSGILDNAFKTLNLRSAFDIEKEKAKLVQAFERIKVSGVASADEIKRAQAALKEQLAGLDKELGKTGHTLRDAFKSLNLRSALDIDKEKARLVASFNQIKTSGVASADEIKRAQAALKEQLAGLDKELGKTGHTLRDAFKSLNLRSALDIDKEKARLVASFNQIKTSGVASADEIKRAQAALKEQLAGLDKELKRNTGGFLSLKGAAGALSGALATVGIGALAKDCIDAALKVQKLETSFRSVSGQDAAREMAFVREEAGRLGLDIASATGEYGKLAAASKGTALEGEETRRIFTALSEASTALGLSGEDAAGALNAVQQMMSKGKVSAEEMRQQLGERLPGAFQIAARAMGVSTAELDKMMERGELTADEFLPKLRAALHDTYGKAAEEASQKGQAAINRFNNEMLETKAKVGEALMPAFTDILQGMKPLSEALVFLLKGFAFLGPLIGMTMDKLAALARAPLDGIDATRKKMEEIENNFFKTVDDIQKRYSGYAESSKKTDQELANEKERNDKRRLDSAKKTDLDMAKSGEAYAKAVGDTDRQLTEKYEKAYQERKKTVEQYYAGQLQAAGDNAAARQDVEIAKFQALLKLEEQHKGDAVLIEMDKARAVLDVIRAGNEDRKSLIEEQVNQRVITERQGRREMLEMEADAAIRSYDLEKSRFEHISGLYDRQTEPYKEALEAMTRARAAHVAAEAELAREAEAVRREEIQKSSLDYQLELQQRLDWLADSERDGLITHQQAARDKLEAEKNYLAQVAELKRRELADAIPDTVEYKQALAEKYEADRAYAEKRKALEDQINADIIAGQEKAAASAKKAADEGAAAFRGLAEGFYAQWDAITNRVIALGPKVAAAFGVSIKDTALNTVDQLRAKLEEVAVSARKAAEAARDIGLFSSLLGEHAKKAEQLTYRYYSQRLAVTELTGQLKQMGLATDWQLRSAASLVREMDLLNDSDLEDLRGEIDRLTQSLKEAEEQAEDTVNSLRDELDQMLGNKEAIEERDYQAKKDDLLARLAEAQEAGNTAIINEYQEALRLLDELHKRKMANIKEEAEAARKAREEAASSSSSSALAPGFAGGGRFPGPDSPVDNLLVRVRSGEWAVNNEAVHFWEKNIGRGFMAGINDPLSAAGRQIWERLKAKAGAWKDYIHVPTPKVNFATGGPFDSARGAGIFPTLAALARAPETPFADAGEVKPVTTQRLILQSPSGKQITTDIHGSVKQFLGLLEEAGMRTV